MDLYELIALLLLSGGVWLWLDTLKAREVGVRAAQQACAEEGLQFLDETVVGRSFRMARDDEGQLKLRRVYGFEYSDTGDNRRSGSVTLLGSTVEFLHIRPQLYVVPKAPEKMTTSIETIEFHGIEALRLNGPRGATAIISKLGGQVLSWQTPDGREHLYLSDKAVFDGSVAIRGGVPVCFPQFAGLGDLPKHGFVRTRPWSVNTERTGEDYALVTLEISDDAETRALWPHPFHAEITLMIEADRIDIEFCVTNTGGAPFDFTGALHSYLRLVQVEDAALEGLYGHDYRDAANGNRIVRDSGTELVVEGVVDRVYHDVKRPQHLKAGNLSLAIQSQGFPDVVVWNPWVELCAGMPDMPADGWRHMLCVEAAIARQPVTLPAGEEWYGRQTLVAV